MDSDLRLLERRIQEDGSEIDQQKLRYMQWRNGFRLKPMPGDTVEIDGFSARTRGIFIRKCRSPSPPFPPFLLNDHRSSHPYLISNDNRSSHTSWFIKIKENLYCFGSDARKIKRRFKLVLIEPLMPGVPSPPEVSKKTSELNNNSHKVDLLAPPYATIFYGTDMIQVPIIPAMSIGEALRRNADDLGFDVNRISTDRSSNQSMFSNPVHQGTIYRQVSSKNQGQIIPHHTIMEDGAVYIVSVYRECKGG